jgi:hypothetical protein
MAVAPDPLTYALLREPLAAVPIDELETRTGITADPPKTRPGSTNCRG